MPIEILMPALSPTMKKGNLAKWLKKENDTVDPGEVIAEIETDKAIMEVESADAGILAKIIVSGGTDDVLVGQAIAILLEEDEDPSVLDNYQIKNILTKSDTSSVTESQEEQDIDKDITGEGKDSNPKTENIASTANGFISTEPSFENQFDLSDMIDKNEERANIGKNIANVGGERVNVSPLAKRLASDYKISLNKVSGTGPNGRIVKSDIEKFVKNKGIYLDIVRNDKEYYAVKNDNMRKVIATRLLESKQYIPHFYLTIDCNLDRLLDLRQQLNEDSGLNEDGKNLYKISVNDLVIKAVAIALKAVPEANSSWTKEATIMYNNIDIAVAVSIDAGLITPIIRNADQKSIFMISNEMKLLAKKAREGKLQPEEFQGGGFSISNLGMYGIKQFNAIINPPQTCILSVGGGEKRVIVDKNGEFQAVSMASFTLSADHRVVDGVVGAQFLQAFKKYIENPVLILM